MDSAIHELRQPQERPPKLRWRTLIRRSVKSWSDDGASSMGAAIAYYTLFSLAPLLLIVISIAGFFFGDEAARGALMLEISRVLGPNGAEAVEATLASARDELGSAFSLPVGIITLLIGATTVLVELQTSLNRIWKVPDPSGSGVSGFVRARLMSVGMILGVGFLLIVSLIVSALISGLNRVWDRWFEGAAFLAQSLNLVVSFAIMTFLFAMIYRWLPRTRIEWRDVWIGGAVTSLLFAIGKYFIGLYIGTAGVSSSFGAAGTLVLVIVWVYYSAQIFLLGAEFTHEYAVLHGSKARSPPYRPQRSTP